MRVAQPNLPAPPSCLPGWLCPQRSKTSAQDRFASVARRAPFRANFNKRLGSRRHQRLHAIHPTDRPGYLANQRVARRVRSRHQPSGHVGGDGNLGIGKRQACEHSLHFLLRRLHQGQRNGALTGSMTARRAPFALARAQALSTAAKAPEMTVWLGEFKFAAATTRPVSAAASRHASATCAASRASTAAIAPWPAGTAKLHGASRAP